MFDDEGPSYKIFYVEDDPNNRRLIRRILLSEGFEVTESPSALEALETIQTFRPDLVLMDINMPDMDGYSLTARFKSLPHLKGVPIIALTANVMRGDREKTIEAGCDGYLQKPVDVDALPDQIRKFIKELGHGA